MFASLKPTGTADALEVAVFQYTDNPYSEKTASSRVGLQLNLYASTCRRRRQVEDFVPTEAFINQKFQEVAASFVAVDPEYQDSHPPHLLCCGWVRDRASYPVMYETAALCSTEIGTSYSISSEE